jgi:hypothetical protein
VTHKKQGLGTTVRIKFSLLIGTYLLHWAESLLKSWLVCS